MTPAVSEVNVMMWIFTAFIIGTLIVSTALFVKLARGYDKKYNLLTKEETKSVVRSGAIACFGATFISVATISLIALVGPAITYMRCGGIGAPMWEMMMAQTATTVMGIDFTDKAFTVNCLILCVFCMTLGSAPYFINCLITLKPLDGLVQKASKSNKKVSFMPYLGKSAMMGLLATMASENSFGNTPKSAALTGAIIGSLIAVQLGNKLKKPILNMMCLPIGMVAGMVVGQVVATLIA